MNHLDWIVIFLYMAGVVGFAAYLARRQKDIHDYYLAGKRIRWWESGLSTMATQLGAISFVSAPAFVAMKEGGGLKWLCYEFGVPVALILVMAIIIPTFHRSHYVSIYEYLEKRFDAGTRSLVSLLFQLGRGLATAVSVLAGGLILSTALSISTWSAILLVGIVTVIYDALGGIRVVILSDVFQMVIIVAGILICGGVALSVAGWEAAWVSLGPSRFQILDFKQWGFSPGSEYAFWPMALGGMFLYASYYGCDQSQVQRELSVKGVDGVRKSLLVNALGRFPLVLLYCLMGVLVGAVFARPETHGVIGSVLGSSQAEVAATLENDPDRMVPMFILAFLPHGLIGFLFVAIMAALMSSLDSALNSLSAATIKDFYQRHLRPAASERHYLIASKICTLFWGVFCIVAALLFLSAGEATRQTTIVLINAIGSLLYGPILAAFLLGMLTKKVGAAAVKWGIGTGIVANILIWQFSSISWLWWNVTGFLVTVTLALVLSTAGLHKARALEPAAQFDPEKDVSPINWPAVYKMLGLYFFLIILIAYLIERTA